MNRHDNNRRSRWQICTVLTCLAMMGAIMVGGTMAWLHTASKNAKNTFLPAYVTCDVEEQFDGVVKSNVSVKNTSDVPVYIRVKLVSYRVNWNLEKIGGAAPIPEFLPGDGWVQHGGFYYYRNPVEPGQKPDTALVGEDGIWLTEYIDANGGKQVIEVMAEAIQADGRNADGEKAVVAAWGVDPETLV